MLPTQARHVWPLVLMILGVLSTIPTATSDHDGGDPHTQLTAYYVTTVVEDQVATTTVQGIYENRDPTLSSTPTFTVNIPAGAIISAFTYTDGHNTTHSATVTTPGTLTDLWPAIEALTLMPQFVQVAGVDRFTTGITIPANSHARITITYDWIVQTIDFTKTLYFHLNPGQVVTDLRLSIRVYESAGITSAESPQFKEEPHLAVLTFSDNNKALEVNYSPLASVQGNEGYGSTQYGLNTVFTLVLTSAQPLHLTGTFISGNAYFSNIFIPPTGTYPVYNNRVVFVYDNGDLVTPLQREQTIIGLASALRFLTPDDTFNLIAVKTTALDFGAPYTVYSTTMQAANDDTVTHAINWLQSQSTTTAGTLGQREPASSNLGPALLYSLALLSNDNAITHYARIPNVVYVGQGEVTQLLPDTPDIEHSIRDAVRRANGVLQARISALGTGTANLRLLTGLALDTQGVFRVNSFRANIAQDLYSLFSQQLATTVLTDVEITIISLSNTAISDLTTWSTQTRYLNNGNDMVTFGRVTRGSPNQPFSVTSARVEIKAVRADGLQVQAFSTHDVRVTQPLPVGHTVPLVVGWRTAWAQRSSVALTAWEEGISNLAAARAFATQYNVMIQPARLSQMRIALPDAHHSGMLQVMSQVIPQGLDTVWRTDEESVAASSAATHTRQLLYWATLATVAALVLAA